MIEITPRMIERIESILGSSDEISTTSLARWIAEEIVFVANEQLAEEREKSCLIK